MKTELITAKPCVWNVSSSYLNSTNDNAQLKVLRKIPIVGTQRSKLTVSINNGKDQIFILGKNGEYFNGKQPLTKVLELAASIGNSKVSIK